MADVNKKVKIEVNADTSNAQEELGKVNKQIDELNRQSKSGNMSLSAIWSSFKSGIGSAKSLTEALRVVGASLKALIANPIGAVIAAVSVAVKALTDAFKRNDDAATALQRVMGLLQVPLKLIQRLVDALVSALGKMLDKFMDNVSVISTKVQPVFVKIQSTITSVTTAMHEFADKLEETAKKWRESGNIFGKIAGMIFGGASKVVDGMANGAEAVSGVVGDAMKEGNELRKNTDGLIKRQDALEEMERQHVVEKAKRDRRIAELNEMVSDSERTPQERMKAFEEIQKLEQANLQAELKMADERIAIKKLEQQVNNDTSDAAKNELTSLQAAREGAYTAYLNGQRTYNKRKAALDKQIEADEKARQKEAEDRAKRLVDLENKVKEIQLQHIRDVAEANGGLTGALSVLSAEYMAEQEKIAAGIEEYRSKMADADEEEKQRIQAVIDALGVQMVDSTNKYKKNVENIIAGSGTVLKDFEADTTQTFEQQKEALADVYESEQQQLQEALDNKLITEEQYAQKSIELANWRADQEAEITKKQTEQEKEYLKNRANVANDMLDSLGSVMNSIATAYGNEAEALMAKGDEMTDAERQQAIEALENQKKAMWVSFAIQQAQAIGSAVLAAATASPSGGVAAPVVYAAVFASLLAGIISSFISAKKSISGIDAKIAELKAPKKEKKLAKGGYVEGAGSGTSDSIPARLSNGESVINARSTALYYDLLSRINQEGGGRAFPNAIDMPSGLRFAQGGVAYNTEGIKNTVVEAVKDIQPVVSVKEITRLQNRVKMKEGK